MMELARDFRLEFLRRVSEMDPEMRDWLMKQPDWFLYEAAYWCLEIIGQQEEDDIHDAISAARDEIRHLCNNLDQKWVDEKVNDFLARRKEISDYEDYVDADGRA